MDNLIRYFDTELNFEYDQKPGVKTKGIRPVAWYLIRLVGLAIFKKTGKVPVMTDCIRTVQEQIQAMSGMQTSNPDLYDKVYKIKQDPATMPHVEFRAADWRFRGYEEAESLLIEINAFYLDGAKELLGYKPSSIIVPEKAGGVVHCLHVQAPRQIPDENKYRSYLTATFGRV